MGSWVGEIYAWFMIYWFLFSPYSLRSSGCHNSSYLKPCSLKFEAEWPQITWILTPWRSEAVEAEYRILKNKSWIRHKSPLLRIPKINAFCLECHFNLKISWFEVGQSMFKHPVRPRVPNLKVLGIWKIIKMNQ